MVKDVGSNPNNRPVLLESIWKSSHSDRGLLPITCNSLCDILTNSSRPNDVVLPSVEKPAASLTLNSSIQEVVQAFLPNIDKSKKQSIIKTLDENCYSILGDFVGTDPASLVAAGVPALFANKIVNTITLMK